MIIFINDLIKKSDDELIAISKGKIPAGMLSAKSTTTAEDMMIAAAAELHRRKKEQENNNLLLQTKNLSIQKRILRVAVIGLIIAAITLAVVLLQFCQKPARISSEQQQNYHNNPAKQPRNELQRER